MRFVNECNCSVFVASVDLRSVYLIHRSDEHRLDCCYFIGIASSNVVVTYKIKLF